MVITARATAASFTRSLILRHIDSRPGLAGIARRGSHFVFVGNDAMALRSCYRATTISISRIIASADFSPFLAAFLILRFLCLRFNAHAHSIPPSIMITVKRDDHAAMRFLGVSSAR